jgi:hypothetical protein
MKPRYLVIPPELKWIAREILGTPNKPYVTTTTTGVYSPGPLPTQGTNVGTSDINAINALLAEDLMYFVGHYFTSVSAWFLVGEKEAHTLKFMNRENLEEDFSDDFDTRTIKQIATMRFSTGATHWLGTWGSNGP